ncbi:MAG: hypothetical protein QXY84_03605 [Candidatus Caldarchaeum sp.]
MNHTFVVVFEGVDGSGKTTLMQMTSKKLAQLAHKVETYKTPSSSATGVFALQHGNEPETDPFTRMLLFLANTSDDSSTIKAIISEKKPDFFFIDRYNLCSIVYGFALISKKQNMVIDEKKFIQFYQLVEELGANVFVQPDLILVVNVDTETRKKLTAFKQPSYDRKIETDEAIQRTVQHFYEVYADWRPAHVWKVYNRENEAEKIADEIARKLSEERRRLLLG